MMPSESASVRKNRTERGAVAPAVRKGLTQTKIIGRVLELQHAALLKCQAGEPGDIDELNDAVRSLLDAFWNKGK